MIRNGNTQSLYRGKEGVKGNTDSITFILFLLYFFLLVSYSSFFGMASFTHLKEETYCNYSGILALS